MKARASVFLSILMVLPYLTAPLFPADGQNSRLLAIKGAKIVPVAGDDIPSGVILIKDGRIEAVGKDVVVPEDATIIDASGLIAYPGMIDGRCSLGLSEISGVSATVDSRETGRINPQVMTVEAIRYDSMHIPIARANGITAALVAPSGGLVSGQSALIRLDGWTNREMVIKSPAAMHVELPGISRGRARGFGFGRTEEAVTTAKALDELKDLLARARAYQKRKEAALKNLALALPEFDESLECLFPVLRREMPVMISVHAEKDIQAAIDFVKGENLRAVFCDVEQGWKVAEDLKKADIPVVFGSLYGMPPVFEDGYDSLYRNPGVLSKAGVKIAFSSSSSSSAKDLPWHAAKAAAFGLDKKEALKAVTIYPAEIFGVDKILGSLEKGKAANIVLADGDILELRTKIKKVYINGKECDLHTKFEEFIEKFEKRD